MEAIEKIITQRKEDIENGSQTDHVDALSLLIQKNIDEDEDEVTMDQLKDIESIEVDKIKVKGKEELITIYKPVMKKEDA